LLGAYWPITITAKSLQAPLTAIAIAIIREITMREKLTKLKPDPRQEIAIQKMIASPTNAALNASLMGVGKTLMAVESALRLEAKTILVIAPLNTFWGWHDAIQRQTDYNAYGLFRIDSTKQGIKALAELADGRPGWYFVGREYFRTKDWSKIKPDMALVDECHFMQNRASKGFKVAKTLKAGYKMSMSGTPFGNRFEGFWAVSRFLWPDDKIVPKSYWKWVEAWAKTQYSPFAGVEVVGEKVAGAFANTLPCYVRLEPDYNIDVVYETRYVDLVPAQRKIYEKFQKDLVVFLQENPLVAEVPIAARIRLRQMTLAVPSITEDEMVYFAEDAVSTKYKALVEIIEDNPTDKMLILTDSQKYAKIVNNRLNTKFGDGCSFEWSGQASQANREIAKQRFIKDDLQYIVAVIPAIAEGVDGLQDACRTVVWLSHSDSNILNQQVLDRVRRRGQQRVVQVYDIVARDTYDEGQLDVLLQRELDLRASLKEEK
jgi:SNF2 family DNA or RNA helicase